MDAVFQHLIPFRFLSTQEQEKLGLAMELMVVPAGARIIRARETGDRTVFVLLEGSVQLVDPATFRVLGLVEPGQYFGERAALFDIQRDFDAIAREPVRCVAMEEEAFLEAIAASPAFALALGQILRVKQGLLKEFDRFKAALLHGASTNRLFLEDLARLYQDLHPALHHYANDPDTIDFNAFSYALHRLPDNITRTFYLFLTDNLPDLYSNPEATFTSIPTHARRRTVYEMMPGKSMVLLRDGVSDVIDLLTCLCLYRVEAKKIRKRFTNPGVCARLFELRKDPDARLDALPFSPSERRRLRELWPRDAIQKIFEITVHHEDIGLEITNQLDAFNVRHSERWTLQIAEATRALLGHDPQHLPDDMVVHIISSNTHSVLNCLSPYLAEEREAIMAWGQEHHPELLALPWSNPNDRLYAVARLYLKAHPEARALRRATEDGAGLYHLEETAFTGIEVELIDTGRLAGRRYDPDIPALAPDRRALIVNIDYAFGQQAEEILSNLILLFGHRLASINILGKAGALQGKRGDLLVASSFIEHTDDLLHSPPRPPRVQPDRLRERLPQAGLYQGPMLTVAGTLLQNSTMLNFYRRIWRCVGLEMEGAYYLRQILKARALGLIRPELDLRFLYYVSDVPLDPDATLAGPLGASEGIPPLYAITREVLTSIFEQEAARPARH